MAVNDPTAGVPTPTGVLQGAAVFSWDGSTWQPSARASVGVGTPTGVLRGVAPFSWSGSAWTPAGGGPEVASTGGVLDGVAVYTWSGSAWVPAGGGPDTPTPTGVLQGVAAFYWDGTAWQPSGQAGPDVATPAGVLQGMAMFNVTAAGAVPAAIFDLNFMSPSALPSSVTFSRASTATYFNSAGVMQTAAVNAPRWDYNPSTLALNGMLIEEARTNVALNSGNLALWGVGNVTVAPPTVTANQVTAPDGTVTGARIAYPAVSGAGAVSVVQQNITVTANVYSLSIWLRGAVGGERLYLGLQFSSSFYSLGVTLTTQWQRFTFVTPALTAGAWWVNIGTDLRDVSQTSTPAQTVYAWGAQLEQGAFATSYIPTTGASVARAQDLATLASIPGRNVTAETFQSESLLYPVQSSTNPRIVAYPIDGRCPNYVNVAAMAGGSFDTAVGFLTSNAFAAGTVAKIAGAWSSPNAGTVCLNGGPVAASTGQTVGFAAMTTVQFMGDNNLSDLANGWFRRFRYWPRVLSNTEMQQVTT